jgi:nitrite reductase (NADH) large subunit
MAGVAVVEAILKTKKQTAITIFGDESYTNYNRILLSDVLAGKTSFEKIVLNTQEWYTDNGIDLRLGVSVNAIDPVSKSVIDANGQATPYDSLVLAMGGLPYLPPILGSNKKGIMVFRTMDETKEIVRLARGSTEAVVIGGGLLGLEAARGLMNYGVSVSVVHLLDRLMEQQLDDVGASLLKREIERMGIRIVLNATAKEIVGDEEVSGVVLTTGETIPCNMALICAGIRPNLTLTKTAGIFVNRGVLVNDQMQTNVPDIFAVGDLIEHREKTYGLVAPLKDQSAVVADAIMGEGKKMYHGTVCATTLKVAGVSVTSAGNFYGGGISEAISFLDSEKGIYKKCVFTRNRLDGFILLGDNKDSTRLFNLIAKGEEIKNKGVLLGNLSIEEGELPSSGVFAMADSEFVCNCNSVTKGEIITAIREKGLKTREQVATCTLAGTGCGSCTQLVDDLLIGPQSITAPVALIQNPSSPGGVEAIKTLDLDKVKQDGLGIDFERLKRDGARGISVEDRYRLKTYGFCAQKHPGYFMLRHRIPGGVLTSSQLAHLAGLCETYGRNNAHITVRQNLELHWVRVEDALDIFEKLRNIGITTRSSCGHTLRNVVACPHGTVAPEGLLDVAPWAARVSDYYVSQSALINPTMPNRINVYFSSCHACNADAVLNDIAFVAVSRVVNGIQEIGFELWVGGSLGTHPMLAFKIRDFIPVADSLAACIAIFEIHTKFGDRAKARSRLKYLIQQWGREKFVAMFDRLFLEKKSLPENLALPAITENKQGPNQAERFLASIMPIGALPSGVFHQRQRGYVRLVVDVPVGEISAEQLAAVGKIAERLGDGRVHFTKNQNLELHWIRARQIKRVTRLLNRVALHLKGEVNTLNILACPGTEFCPLAITNAFGAARDVLKSFHPDHSEKAALLKSISIHISGCPNSCARHQVGDIGLAGTLVAVGDLRWYSYQLFLGGTSSPGQNSGVRVGEMVRKGITDKMIVPTIDGLLDVVLEQRKPGETFQAVMTRLTPKKVVALLEPKLSPYLPEASHEVAMAMGLVEVS